MTDWGPVPGIRALPSRGVITVTMVEGLPIPVVISRIEDDRIVRINHEFSTAYGHTSEFAVGREVRDLHFVAEDRLDALRRHSDGALESVEVRLRSADGASHWAQSDISRFELDGHDVLLSTFYDIGDRKRAEALLEEMARFPEMNPGPVLRLDLDGIIRRGNPAARAVLGPDLLGRCFWEVCPDFSEEARAKVLVGGEKVREDVQIGARWMRLTVTHAVGTDEIFIFGTDVTKERLAEQTLAERARFPAMNPGPVARLDITGVVLRANPAAAAVFGCTDIVGLSWRDLCPGVDDELWGRVTSDGAVGQYEERLGERWYSFTLRHEPVAHQIFVYGSDMTELKAAERALAELARFPDMNPGPVCRLDRSGTVLLANPAARDLFGTKDLTGARWFDLVPAVDEVVWENILSSPRATVVETRVGGSDLVVTHAVGAEGLYVFAYGSDVTRQKEAERALRQSEKMATLGTLAAGLAHELNNPAAAARRAAEQLREAFAEQQRVQYELVSTGFPDEGWTALAARAEEALDRVVAEEGSTGMQRAQEESALEEWLDAHGVDESWVLAPVLLDAGQSAQDLERLVEQVGAEHLPQAVVWQACTYRVFRLVDEVRNGAGRISELVGAMKDYSHLGQAPVQDVDVNAGIRTTLVILRNRLTEGITVEQELSPSLPRIEALGSELNQVWTNLIDNAIHAVAGRGRIRIRSSLSDNRIVVDVEDDGPGIADEHRDRVFDAFFTTKAPGEGTGLGLHTTYSIVVEKHGGSIHFASEPGRTCFTVELPLELGPRGSRGEAPST
jgi:PAS domain S-box-containing protein